ncbi:MAG TPA: hypothetical protein VGF67_22500 [Ktedonobacteraceae bacterium]|jgi:hypothetical protein
MIGLWWAPVHSQARCYIYLEDIQKHVLRIFPGWGLPARKHQHGRRVALLEMSDKRIAGRSTLLF